MQLMQLLQLMQLMQLMQLCSSAALHMFETHYIVQLYEY